MELAFLVFMHLNSTHAGANLEREERLLNSACFVERTRKSARRPTAPRFSYRIVIHVVAYKRILYHALVKGIGGEGEFFPLHSFVAEARTKENGVAVPDAHTTPRSFSVLARFRHSYFVIIHCSSFVSITAESDSSAAPPNYEIKIRVKKATHPRAQVYSLTRSFIHSFTHSLIYAARGRRQAHHFNRGQSAPLPPVSPLNLRRLRN